MNKSLTIKQVFEDYKSGKMKKLETYQIVGILMLVVVLAGFVGWIYEFIFYYFDGGMTNFYMQGGNFLPWINIYAIGALLIIATTWKIRRYPWAVFLISAIVTGILEYVAGWLVYTIGGGIRYWDYNVEILNFGNIGGFVCLRSVLAFGVSALLLMYIVTPFVIYLSKKMSKKMFLTLAILLFSLVMIDEVYNLLASKFFAWPDAMNFYRSMGWKYLT